MSARSSIPAQKKIATTSVSAPGAAQAQDTEESSPRPLHTMEESFPSSGQSKKARGAKAAKAPAPKAAKAKPISREDPIISTVSSEKKEAEASSLSPESVEQHAHASGSGSKAASHIGANELYETENMDAVSRSRIYGKKSKMTFAESRYIQEHPGGSKTVIHLYSVARGGMKKQYLDSGHGVRSRCAEGQLLNVDGRELQPSDGSASIDLSQARKHSILTSNKPCPDCKNNVVDPITNHGQVPFKYSADYDGAKDNGNYRKRVSAQDKALQDFVPEEGKARETAIAAKNAADKAHNESMAEGDGIRHLHYIVDETQLDDHSEKPFSGVPIQFRQHDNANGTHVKMVNLNTPDMQAYQRRIKEAREIQKGTVADLERSSTEGKGKAPRSSRSSSVSEEEFGQSASSIPAAAKPKAVKPTRPKLDLKKPLQELMPSPQAASASSVPPVMPIEPPASLQRGGRDGPSRGGYKNPRGGAPRHAPLPTSDPVILSEPPASPQRGGRGGASRGGYNSPRGGAPRHAPLPAPDPVILSEPSASPQRGGRSGPSRGGYRNPRGGAPRHAPLPAPDPAVILSEPPASPQRGGRGGSKRGGRYWRPRKSPEEQ